MSKIKDFIHSLWDFYKEYNIARILVRIIITIIVIWTLSIFVLKGIKNELENTIDKFTPKQETITTLLDFEVKQ